MRVLIADKLSIAAVARLEAAGCAVTSQPSLSGATLVAALSELDPQVLVVRSTKVDAAHLAAAAQLALIVRAGAGVNTIDVAGAAARGVYVANCPGRNAAAVAELAMGHLVNADRRIADGVAELRAGRWDKKGFSQARGLYGRTLAVLGLGAIGQAVVTRAQAFGMDVRGWSRSLTPERAKALGVHFAASPLDACRGADAVTVHLPLNDDTRGIVGAELLEALVPGAIVINTARGGVVDQVALARGVRTRGLRAGLDVFEVEPAGGDAVFADEIGGLPGVYGTHHIGASTEQASEAIAAEVVRVVQTWVRTGRVLNCVNIARQSPATHMLVVRHADRVGVLAAVLDHLQRASVNVQEMENVIFQGANAACARIQLNGAPGVEVVSAIKRSEDIFAASVVALGQR